MTAESVQVFDELWDRYAAQVRDGRSSVENTMIGSQPILTAVSRLAPVTAQSLAAAAEKLGLASHYLYPPGDIHFTLLYLTPYVSDRLEGDKAKVMEQVGKVIADSCQGLPQIIYKVVGVGVFPTTVFAQLVPVRNGLTEEYRRRIASALRQARFYGAQAETYEAQLKWDLAFANIARFTGPVSPDVVARVKPLRGVNFGTTELESVELVSTDKFLSKGATEVFLEVEFG